MRPCFFSLDHVCPTFKGYNSPQINLKFLLSFIPKLYSESQAGFLVSDEEIKAAVSALYRSGLVVEPSGCAAFAAIVNNKIPELEGKNIVCILSGGNIGKDELSSLNLVIQGDLEEQSCIQMF
uniref:Tryptophan synthase beta chain-like PALP domain-containing protein n=1 Tax=Lates calcarifer TaxID=8187 RepID=A0A4W6E4Q2_LATCA